MKRIRIGYFADGPWSHNALALLLENPSIEVSFIVPRSDSTDSKLYDYAKAYDIPYYKGYSINSNEFLEIAKEYQCELFVSMSFNQIFKSEIINIPKIGIINCHAGKLPFYRGRNILNWALINDEKEFGITVHFVDEGIDTGDVILQKSFPITEQDSYKTLLDIAYKECANLLYEVILQIKDEKYSRIKQKEIHSVGFYCGQRRPGDEIINWSMTSRELFNFIRAICLPGPQATTTLNGKIIKINSSTMIMDAINYKCINGQIVGKTADGFVVKTSDSVVEIKDIDSGDVKIKIGDRLGT